MKYKVRYQVNFIAEIEVTENDSLIDAISDIDIPEGGKNNSQYWPFSFEIVEVIDKNNNVVNVPV